MKELYYSPQEAAKLLGVSNATIYTWCKNGELDGAMQIGRTWFIPKATIDPKPKTPPIEATNNANRNASE